MHICILERRVGDVVHLAQLDHLVELVDGFAESGHADVSRLVHHCEREELSLAFGVRVRLDHALVRHATADRPTTTDWVVNVNTP